LSSSGKTLKEFRDLLKKARQEVPLTFANLFTPDQLTPVRLRSDDHSQPTAQDKEIILRAVFTPIV
jgi:hypothetical protein